LSKFSDEISSEANKEVRTFYFKALIVYHARNLAKLKV